MDGIICNIIPIYFRNYHIIMTGRVTLEKMLSAEMRLVLSGTIVLEESSVQFVQLFET